MQSLGGKLVGKRPLGRPRLTREDNTKMGHREVGSGAWIGLIWHMWQAVVNALMNLRAP